MEDMQQEQKTAEKEQAPMQEYTAVMHILLDGTILFDGFEGLGPAVYVWRVRGRAVIRPEGVGSDLGIRLSVDERGFCRNRKAAKILWDAGLGPAASFIRIRNAWYQV